MGRGEFGARDIKRKRKNQRWLCKSWKRKTLKLKKKFDPTRGAPQAKGVVIEKVIIEQKQPHSGLMKCAKVQLVKNGKLVTVYCPGDGAVNFIDEHDEVVVEGMGGSQRGPMGSIPGVKYKVLKVNGVSLTQLVRGKKEKPAR